MTRAKVLLLGLIVGTAACSNTTTQPSQAAPNSYTFTATLLPANEVPPVSNAERTGSGTVTIVLVVTRDSGGTITAATVTYTVSLTGFPAGTTLTAAHIHEGAATCACPVRVLTSLANGEVVLTSGSGGFTKQFAAQADIAQGMINNSSNYYFNVHTPSNPGGAARGQLSLQ